jgi:hypothetical protein
MFDGLNQFAAGASDLIRCVPGKEMLSVLPGESVSCDKAVKCRLCESRELNFGFVVAWGVRQRVGAERRICVRWLESGVLSPVRGFNRGC